MIRKFKQWWSTIHVSPISTNQTITSHLKPMDTKKTMTYNVENKSRHYNGQKKNNRPQNTEHKTLHGATHDPPKIGSELMCSGRVRHFCSHSKLYVILRNNLQIFVLWHFEQNWNICWRRPNRVMDIQLNMSYMDGGWL